MGGRKRGSSNFGIRRGALFYLLKIFAAVFLDAGLILGLGWLPNVLRHFNRGHDVCEQTENTKAQQER